jgi:hypothetical protein
MTAPRLSKKEREAVCAAIDFVLAGDIDETVFSEQDVAALETARDKLIDAEPKP